MNDFTIKIIFKNGKKKTITHVDTITYGTQFMDNKWKLYLNISHDISYKPEYYNYKGSNIDKIEIINKGGK